MLNNLLKIAGLVVLSLLAVMEAIVLINFIRGA